MEGQQVYSDLDSYGGEIKKGCIWSGYMYGGTGEITITAHWWWIFMDA